MQVVKLVWYLLQCCVPGPARSKPRDKARLIHERIAMRLLFSLLLLLSPTMPSHWGYRLVVNFSPCAWAPIAKISKAAAPRVSTHLYGLRDTIWPLILRNVGFKGSKQETDIASRRQVPGCTPIAAPGKPCLWLKSVQEPIKCYGRSVG
jgi:hypothetical protein